jgi:rSAM/selenodomain-associated transferase 2
LFFLAMGTEAISIVIPVLNEAEHLPGLLEDIAAQQGVDCEIIVVDAGSRDGSQAIASRLGAKVLTSARGRGRQMNQGVAAASHDVLFFLHADSALPEQDLLKNALLHLKSLWRTRGHHQVAGHFALKFACHQQDCGRVYSFLEAKSALNRPHTFNGDQGLLLHRSFLQTLGGFDESLPFLEDQRIGRKIRAQGEWTTLPGRLVTSARRFETEGFWQRYALMAIMMGAFVTDCDEFFEALPDIYPEQQETGRLDLSSFFLRLYPVLGRMGPERVARALMCVGGFVRENAWQMALIADLATCQEGRLLGYFDAHVEHRMESATVDLCAGVVTFATVFAVLPVVSACPQLMTAASPRQTRAPAG